MALYAKEKKLWSQECDELQDDLSPKPQFMACNTHQSLINYMHTEWQLIYYSFVYVLIILTIASF